MKIFKPRTPSLRGTSVEDFSNLEKGKLPKQLIQGKKRNSGRNAHGRITSYQTGGGHKRNYRLVEFRRHLKSGVKARVAGLYYDPNRSARLALLNYVDGSKGLILAPFGVTKGDMIECGPEADIRPGNALPLSKIPVGTLIHCIELKPGSGAQLARSAGAEVMLAGKDGKDAQLKLPSGELRLVSLECWATVGKVGNVEHESLQVGKAGRSRWMGRRPHVRGVVMNPVDHPHGGGEGRTSGGRHPVTPWGQPTKGYKTRKNKRTSSRIIRGRPRGKMTRGKG